MIDDCRLKPIINHQPSIINWRSLVAVRIRMKQMGRKHRHFFRIVAIDSRQPRDGRIIEELGTYDPHVADTNSRVILNPDRIKHWLGVGALPSEKVAVLFKKYMKKWEEKAVADAAPPAPPAETPAPTNA
jgi:small subunit ribosomal protein S16